MSAAPVCRRRQKNVNMLIKPLFYRKKEVIALYKYRPPINKDTITFLAKKNDEDGIHIGKTTNNFVLYRNFIFQFKQKYQPTLLIV